ncbi:MAG: hypothetical protein UW41_C0003G0051 [Candidatus Collierbacteria bacterium GW2011_GWC2_44_18]|uniref:Uncharacterized protein n=1 Tax=Candidatus Collierbacteria bacterium GW2011_GWC2_44_18 TaxID=1618392 RepID=A0A0G1KP16_9BACT|nr:MAG: hypothetical protein UW41_C0003G0051 [Candidatus Collierbacteria bacterium GW2011_GWC2_44_18]
MMQCPESGSGVGVGVDVVVGVVVKVGFAVIKGVGEIRMTGGTVCPRREKYNRIDTKRAKLTSEMRKIFLTIFI